MMIECKVERYQSNGAHHEWSVDLDETSAGNLLDSLLNEWSATLWIPGKAQELAVSTSSGMVALMLTAGDDAFYDCIGDDYTAFDLSKRYTLAGDGATIDLTYDGNQRRIRKATATAETLYVSGLYERVTRADNGDVEHRFYVYAGGRVVAVAARSLASPAGATVYLHVDRLGSTDVVSGDGGAEIERRSYDAFGARRNPHWTEAPPASFGSATILEQGGASQGRLHLAPATRGARVELLHGRRHRRRLAGVRGR